MVLDRLYRRVPQFLSFDFVFDPRIVLWEHQGQAFFVEHHGSSSNTVAGRLTPRGLFPL